MRKERKLKNDAKKPTGQIRGKEKTVEQNRPEGIGTAVYIQTDCLENRVFGLFCHAELQNGLGRNLDLLAGCRVSAHARLAILLHHFT